MSSFESASFKKLQARFYRKLEADGFSDIEDSKGNLTDHQTAYDFSQRIGFQTDLFESIRDYFAWATEMVHRGDFTSKRDKRIWLLHSDGKSSREIALVVELEQTWVCRKIKMIRKTLLQQEIYYNLDP